MLLYRLRQWEEVGVHIDGCDFCHWANDGVTLFRLLLFLRFAHRSSSVGGARGEQR